MGLPCDALYTPTCLHRRMTLSLVPYYYIYRLLLLPPAAKPTLCCLSTAPQAHRKNCQCWNVWTKTRIHTNMPTIYRPTDRQTLYLTTITTAAGTVLPPKQTFAALPAANRLLLLPPIAKLTPSCLPAAPQAQRKNY